MQQTYSNFHYKFTKPCLASQCLKKYDLPHLWKIPRVDKILFTLTQELTYFFPITYFRDHLRLIIFLRLKKKSIQKAAYDLIRQYDKLCPMCTLKTITVIEQMNMSIISKSFFLPVYNLSAKPFPATPTPPRGNQIIYFLSL